MPLPSPAHPQTLWIPLPGLPGRSLRVTLITECGEADDGEPILQETTTAIEAGLALHALTQSTGALRFFQ